MSAPPQWGALACWKAEVRGGTDGKRANAPATWDYSDPIYRAAVVEAQALDAYRQGLESHVRACRAQYDRILQDALREAEDAA